MCGGNRRLPPQKPRRPFPARATFNMLLVLDVGNTNTVLGVFAPKAAPGGSRGAEAESAHYELLVANWRVATVATQTVDEYGVLFRNLFSMDNLEVKGIWGIVLCS